MFRLIKKSRTMRKYHLINHLVKDFFVGVHKIGDSIKQPQESFEWSPER